jgi:hypothetical protein
MRNAQGAGSNVIELSTFRHVEMPTSQIQGNNALGTTSVLVRDRVTKIDLSVPIQQDDIENDSRLRTL